MLKQTAPKGAATAIHPVENIAIVDVVATVKAANNVDYYSNTNAVRSAKRSVFSRDGHQGQKKIPNDSPTGTVRNEDPVNFAIEVTIREGLGAFIVNLTISIKMVFIIQKASVTFFLPSVADCLADQKAITVTL